jgi:hypothetical protein
MLGVRKELHEYTKLLRVGIETEDTTVGQMLWQKWQTLTQQLGHPDTWTPVEPLLIIIKWKKDSNLQVMKKQFPLVPAKAVTIHKS